jgi:hypothetical protein
MGKPPVRWERGKPVEKKRRQAAAFSDVSLLFALLVGDAAAGFAGGLAGGLALAAAALFGAFAEIPGFQSLDSLHNGIAPI